LNATGKPAETLAEALNMSPTTLIADAHAAGLFVHPFTFRDEARNLTQTYRGDPKAEYKAYFALGVDGVFTDFSTTAHAARAEWLADASLHSSGEIQPAR
jgi:glycerophosphoryl diester phosphodiesterase